MEIVDLLFREEASKETYESLWGAVCVSQPVSHKLYFTTFTALFVVCFVLLTNFSYARKEKVSGFISPEKGVAKIYSARHGVVDKIFVKENSIVSSGQPLFLLKYPTDNIIGDSTSKAILGELDKQINLLSKQKERLRLNSDYDVEQLVKINIELRNQILLIEKQKVNAQSKLAILVKRAEFYAGLRNESFVSNIDLENHDQIVIDSKSEILALEIQISSLKQQIDNNLFKLKQIPRITQQEILAISSNQSEKIQKKAEIISLQGAEIKATRNGILSSFNFNEGELVRPQQYLASILPNDGEMIAELFIPTRAFGFIKENQKIRIKLHAFPFQKFGSMEGRLTNISKNVVLPSDIESPVKIDEAVYVVKAKLDTNMIKVNEKEISIQIGMVVEAEIYLESRNLWEFVFEPLISAFN